MNNEHVNTERVQHDESSLSKKSYLDKDIMLTDHHRETVDDREA